MLADTNTSPDLLASLDLENVRRTRADRVGRKEGGSTDQTGQPELQSSSSLVVFFSTLSLSVWQYYTSAFPLIFFFCSFLHETIPRRSFVGLKR